MISAPPKGCVNNRHHPLQPNGSSPYVTTLPPSGITLREGVCAADGRAAHVFIGHEFSEPTVREKRIKLRWFVYKFINRTKAHCELPLMWSYVGKH